MVEYKKTARWNVREQRRDNTTEQEVVKTVAGMLNSRGGTLLIGVTDDGAPAGLDDDYAQVNPPNAEAYVNWLNTLFEHSLGHAGVRRLSIRIDRIGHHDICRIDVPASSRPIQVANKNGPGILYQRPQQLHTNPYHQLSWNTSSPNDSEHPHAYGDHNPAGVPLRRDRWTHASMSTQAINRRRPRKGCPIWSPHRHHRKTSGRQLSYQLNRHSYFKGGLCDRGSLRL